MNDENIQHLPPDMRKSMLSIRQAIIARRKPNTHQATKAPSKNISQVGYSTGGSLNVSHNTKR